ncbi:MAG: Asp-tRNA(Asn)/Glu-tRNA(Gln) amidotransferase GatCAB subunit C [Nanohaloarchaea archaeon SW_7_43_1]|nr:MAG: Asp-tRNA(Asn)/Glu-tRNA(Gln) amidotransferase GatCAB subunit C [Nanohaloarchaea archaeon SW_7_43_1]
MVEPEDVEEIADNARINLEEGEAEKFAEEFENIISIFQKLEKIDTEDVEPAFHPVETDPKTREDEVEETLDKDEVLQNTENEEDGYFKGPSA